ncbi:hypothetical protein D9758_007035 [Tetrapyrgos nigripes]|uniref:Uncharacterized protein n=1 Tax=Tetrapyrgos nigripes TaxID=182062 RepID=A0A8H5GDG3_9AGAR|nr:hypothetical protein D9758_007035 [Tetrapyrgos nigripes]
MVIFSRLLRRMGAARDTSYRQESESKRLCISHYPVICDFDDSSIYDYRSAIRFQPALLQFR